MASLARSCFVQDVDICVPIMHWCQLVPVDRQHLTGLANRRFECRDPVCCRAHGAQVLELILDPLDRPSDIARRDRYQNGPARAAESWRSCTFN